MTKLPRVMISLFPDIQKAVENLQDEPEFQKASRSKILYYLIRKGIERENKEETMWHECRTRKPFIDPQICGDCEKEDCVGCEVWENAVRKEVRNCECRSPTR